MIQNALRIYKESLKEIIECITTVKISEALQILGTKSSVNIMCIWSNKYYSFTPNIPTHKIII